MGKISCGLIIVCTIILSLPYAAPSAAQAISVDLIPADDPRIGVMGRVDNSMPGRVRFGYPGVTLRVSFDGPSLAMRAISNTGNSYMGIFVDGNGPRNVRLLAGENDTILAENLSAGEHTVEIVHQTETWVGLVTILGFRLAPTGHLIGANPWPRRKMLFIGDSVTCGEAVDRFPEWKKNRPASWNAYFSYGMILARTFDSQVHLVCFGGRGLIRDWRGKRDGLNAPQLFDLAVPEEQSPHPWNHAAYIPDVVVVSVGSNDFSLGIGDFPEREEWVNAYVRFVRAIRGRYPAAFIFLTDGAITHDTADGSRPQRSTLTSYIKETARRLADPLVRVYESRYYPGDADDAHPTRPQHAAMAHDIEPIIRSALSW
ncbi:MAG: SGNH/GDSL hydrolase family protein [Candidatus Acidiferrum sp.]